MDQVAMLAGIAFAVNKTISIVKAGTAKDINTVVTQVLVWLVSIGSITLAAHADVTADLVIPGTTEVLSNLNGASLAMLGWMLGGTGSFAFDIKKALDRSDSAQEVPLLPSKVVSPAVPVVVTEPYPTTPPPH